MAAAGRRRAGYAAGDGVAGDRDRLVGMAGVRAGAGAHSAGCAVRSRRRDPRFRLLAAPGAVTPAPTPAKDAGTLAPATRDCSASFAEPDGRGYALFRLPSGPRLVAAGQRSRRARRWSQCDPTASRFATPAASAASRCAATPRRRPPRRRSPSTRAPRAILRARRPRLQGRRAATQRRAVAGHHRAARELARAASIAERARSSCATKRLRRDAGMKKGDRIAQANGIALTAPDDVVVAVLRPLAAKQTVRVTGSRDGAAARVAAAQRDVSEACEAGFSRPRSRAGSQSSRSSGLLDPAGRRPRARDRRPCRGSRSARRCVAMPAAMPASTSRRSSPTYTQRAGGDAQRCAPHAAAARDAASDAASCRR